MSGVRAGGIGCGAYLRCNKDSIEVLFMFFQSDFPPRPGEGNVVHFDLFWLLAFMSFILWFFNQKKNKLLNENLNIQADQRTLSAKA